MKKVICELCGTRRGRRQCILYKKTICGACCSSRQVMSKCPDDCEHKGKLNSKELENKIHSLLEIGIGMIKENPKEAIKLFDKVIEMDGSNRLGYIEKSAAYEAQGDMYNSLECLKKAASIKSDDSVYYRMAIQYAKLKRYNDAIDMILKIRNRINTIEAEFLLADCYYMSGQFHKASSEFNNIIKKDNLSRDMLDKAKFMLSRTYLSLKDINRALEWAFNVEADSDDKKDAIENAYFIGGRMYELLHFLNDSAEYNPKDKFMLLQCSLVLRKNSISSTIKIIDDILNTDFYNKQSYEYIWMIALKIKFLFKDLKLEQCIGVFEENRTVLLEMAKSMGDCFEACCMAAFFYYNIDKNKALMLYNSIFNMSIDIIIIDEFYNAFFTMDLSPYIREKSIERAIKQMKEGKGFSFNRTLIAADVLFENNEYIQAFNFYNIALDESKVDVMILYKMAVCLMKQGRFGEALELLKNVLNKSRFIPGVYAGIIKCCLETDNEWIDYYKQLEIEKLNFSELYELAGNLLVKEHYDKAGYLYNFMLDKYKGMDIYSRKMIYHNMTYVYRKLTDYTKALNIIEEIPPVYREECLTIDLGCLYFDMGQYQKALEVFQSMPEDTTNTVVCFNIGIQYLKLDRYETALEYFNKSIEECVCEIRRRNTIISKDIQILLQRCYRNSSLCYIKIGAIEDALVAIENAVKIENDDKTIEILSLIKHLSLDMEKGVMNNQIKIDMYMDGCMVLKEGFTENIRRLLDGVLGKLYEEKIKALKPDNEYTNNISAFIRNEKRIYNKNKNSIERSNGTFQRYVDNLYKSFEKRVFAQFSDIRSEIAAEGTAEKSTGNVEEYCSALVNAGEKLLRNYEYLNSEEYVYASLIPFFKAVKDMCREKILPYYNKNINKLPVPEDPLSFKNIGIYNYTVGNEEYYRIDFNFNISSSDYLFDINCHPGLRERYFNTKRYYLPWDKLLWIISGIKKRWDVVDDSTSSGLLLLFYCSYKNYLGIEGSFKDNNEILNLAGDLIRLGNERDYYIKVLLNGSYEADYLDAVQDVKNTALRCIDGLLKITI